MRRYRKSGIYAFILVVVALSIFAIARQPVANQLNAWKLLPQPERFTELYFTDHTALPATYQPGQQQQVAFTIHNLEHQKMNYRYVITQQDETANTYVELKNGSFTLSHNQQKHITDTITLQNFGHRSSVHVQLLPQHQAIHYWVIDPSQPEKNLTTESE